MRQRVLIRCTGHRGRRFDESVKKRPRRIGPNGQPLAARSLERHRVDPVASGARRTLPHPDGTTMVRYLPGGTRSNGHSAGRRVHVAPLIDGEIDRPTHS